MRNPIKSHDLSLPNWGPYGKNYAGVSHVADKDRGLRFDLMIFPSLYRRKVEVPNATWEGSYHPWDASLGLDYFSFRHEIIWKDQVYADISYSAIPGMSGRLIRCELVNQTAIPRSLALHFMASMAFPSPWTNSKEPVKWVEPILPEGGVLRHPLNYSTIQYANPEATDRLTPDGGYQGEIRGHDFLDGSGLGGRFGRDAGDMVSYRFLSLSHLPQARWIIRARSTSTTGKSVFNLSGSLNGEIAVRGNRFHTIQLDGGSLKSGNHEVTLSSRGNAEVEIAFLALCSGTTPIEVLDRCWKPRPIFNPSVSANSVILKYPDAPSYYGVAWDSSDFEVREILHDELDIFYRHRTHNHVDSVMNGNRGGHYTNAFMRPIPLAGGSRSVIWGIVCEGSETTVAKSLLDFTSGTISRAATYRNSRAQRFRFRPVRDGRKFLFSQSRLATTLLSNTIYPTYVQRQYVKHRVGGKWWDSLYTWDEGFIGLGLVELDSQQAEESLSQYLTEPDNSHAAFIHHGSMMPVQISLYHELWNRTLSSQMLEKHYPSLRSYYSFFAGHSNGSTTATLQSGLLRPWDYFYNSGGWDDYPPQKHVHESKLADRVAPVITTAMAIRCAKSLALAASSLGLQADVESYSRDVERLTDALNRYSWDDDFGYYSYTVHDKDGRPEGILRHSEGSNYNQGLDGAFPLVAGACSQNQEQTLLSRLFDEKRLWTSIGLSAVDQSTPYYRKDGYWSGTVWFPHQWYFWKTMLDLGRPDLAWRIARTAIEVWRAEVEDSYHCFEHFLVDTGRGAGWHQFSSLSSPLLSFFAACYCPGHITYGFEAWPMDASFSEDNTAFSGKVLLTSRPNGPRSALIRMNPKHTYQAFWNHQPVELETYASGFLGLKLNADSTAGVLQVRPV